MDSNTEVPRVVSTQDFTTKALAAFGRWIAENGIGETDEVVSATAFAGGYIAGNRAVFTDAYTYADDTDEKMPDETVAHPHVALEGIIEFVSSRVKGLPAADVTPDTRYAAGYHTARRELLNGLSAMLKRYGYEVES